MEGILVFKIFYENVILWKDFNGNIKYKGCKQCNFKNITTNKINKMVYFKIGIMWERVVYYKKQKK